MIVIFDTLVNSISEVSLQEKSLLRIICFTYTTWPFLKKDENFFLLGFWIAKKVPCVLFQGLLSCPSKEVVSLTANRFLFPGFVYKFKRLQNGAYSVSTTI